MVSISQTQLSIVRKVVSPKRGYTSSKCEINTDFENLVREKHLANNILYGLLAEMIILNVYYTTNKIH